MPTLMGLKVKTVDLWRSIGHGWQIGVYIFGGISTVVGCVVLLLTIPDKLDAAGFPVYATRSFMRSYITEKFGPFVLAQGETRSIAYDGLIRQWEKEKSDLLRERFSLNAKKAENPGNAQALDLWNWRIEQITHEDLPKAEEKIKELKAQKAGR